MKLFYDFERKKKKASKILFFKKTETVLENKYFESKTTRDS